MADKDAPKAATPEEWHSERNEPVIPGYWGPNMLLYADISRLLFRMHRNVAAHMDAHKRLMERLQSVFQHEQAMVLELAKVINEATAHAANSSSEKQPPAGKDGVERVFEHASKAMAESGKMLTEIQLEALSLLKHYIEDSKESAPKGSSPPSSAPDATGKTSKSKG